MDTRRSAHIILGISTLRLTVLFALTKVLLITPVHTQTQFARNSFSNELFRVQTLDYPVFHRVPRTSFSCRNQNSPGYYADPETRCQVFHVCVRQFGRLEQFSFLCPNQTVFHQQLLVCVWWHSFDCLSAPSLYYINEDIFGSEDESAVGKSLTNRLPSALLLEGPIQRPLALGQIRAGDLDDLDIISHHVILTDDLLDNDDDDDDDERDENERLNVANVLSSFENESTEGVDDISFASATTANPIALSLTATQNQNQNIRQNLHTLVVNTNKSGDDDEDEDDERSIEDNDNIIHFLQSKNNEISDSSLENLVTLQNFVTVNHPAVKGLNNVKSINDLLNNPNIIAVNSENLKNNSHALDTPRFQSFQIHSDDDVDEDDDDDKIDDVYDNIDQDDIDDIPIISNHKLNPFPIKNKFDASLEETISNLKQIQNSNSKGQIVIIVEAGKENAVNTLRGVNNLARINALSSLNDDDSENDSEEVQILQKQVLFSQLPLTTNNQASKVLAFNLSNRNPKEHLVDKFNKNNINLSAVNENLNINKQQKNINTKQEVVPQVKIVKNQLDHIQTSQRPQLKSPDSQPQNIKTKENFNSTRLTSQPINLVNSSKQQPNFLQQHRLNQTIIILLQNNSNQFLQNSPVGHFLKQQQQGNNRQQYLTGNGNENSSQQQQHKAAANKKVSQQNRQQQIVQQTNPKQTVPKDINQHAQQNINNNNLQLQAASLQHSQQNILQQIKNKLTQNNQHLLPQNNTQQNGQQHNSIPQQNKQHLLNTPLQISPQVIRQQQNINNHQQNIQSQNLPVPKNSIVPQTNGQNHKITQQATNQRNFDSISQQNKVLQNSIQNNSNNLPQKIHINSNSNVNNLKNSKNKANINQPSKITQRGNNQFIAQTNNLSVQTQRQTKNLKSNLVQNIPIGQVVNSHQLQNQVNHLRLLNNNISNKKNNANGFNVKSNSNSIDIASSKTQDISSNAKLVLPNNNLKLLLDNNKKANLHFINHNGKIYSIVSSNRNRSPIKATNIINVKNVPIFQQDTSNSNVQNGQTFFTPQLRSVGIPLPTSNAQRNIRVSSNNLNNKLNNGNINGNLQPLLANRFQIPVSLRQGGIPLPLNTDSHHTSNLNLNVGNNNNAPRQSFIIIDHNGNKIFSSNSASKLNILNGNNQHTQENKWKDKTNVSQQQLPISNKDDKSSEISSIQLKPNINIANNERTSANLLGPFRRLQDKLIKEQQLSTQASLQNLHQNNIKNVPNVKHNSSTLIVTNTQNGNKVFTNFLIPHSRIKGKSLQQSNNQGVQNELNKIQNVKLNPNTPQNVLIILNDGLEAIKNLSKSNFSSSSNAKIPVIVLSPSWHNLTQSFTNNPLLNSSNHKTSQVNIQSIGTNEPNTASIQISDINSPQKQEQISQGNVKRNAVVLPSFSSSFDQKFQNLRNFRNIPIKLPSIQYKGIYFTPNHYQARILSTAHQNSQPYQNTKFKLTPTIKHKVPLAKSNFPVISPSASNLNYQFTHRNGNFEPVIRNNRGAIKTMRPSLLLGDNISEFQFRPMFQVNSN